MRNRFLLILSVLFCFSLNVEAKIFSGYYISIKSDTVYCDFNVRVRPFQPNTVDPISFKYGVKSIDSQGKKSKLKPFHIKSFVLFGTEVGTSKYVSYSFVGEAIFVKEVLTGTANLYMYYFPQTYDGMANASYLVNSEMRAGIVLSLSGFRKRLRKYFAGNEFFEERLEGNKLKYGDIYDLIKSYNELSENQ